MSRTRQVARPVAGRHGDDVVGLDVDGADWAEVVGGRGAVAVHRHGLGARDQVGRRGGLSEEVGGGVDRAEGAYVEAEAVEGEHAGGDVGAVAVAASPERGVDVHGGQHVGPVPNWAAGCGRDAGEVDGAGDGRSDAGSPVVGGVLAQFAAGAYQDGRVGEDPAHGGEVDRVGAGRGRREGVVLLGVHRVPPRGLG